MDEWTDGWLVGWLAASLPLVCSISQTFLLFVLRSPVFRQHSLKNTVSISIEFQALIHSTRKKYSLRSSAFGKHSLKNIVSNSVQSEALHNQLRKHYLALDPFVDFSKTRPSKIRSRIQSSQRHFTLGPENTCIRSVRKTFYTQVSRLTGARTVTASSE